MGCFSLEPLNPRNLGPGPSTNSLGGDLKRQPYYPPLSHLRGLRLAPTIRAAIKIKRRESHHEDFSERFSTALEITLLWIFVASLVSCTGAGLDSRTQNGGRGHLATASVDAAETDRSLQKPPASPWPHERSDLAPDPAVVFGQLPNGFRYALMENRTPRDRVSIHLNVMSGSLNENDDQKGVAHFLEHMLFNGSTHFKPGELVKYFQSIGMQFGADANAYTGFDETVYLVLLPEGDEKNLSEGLLVMRDYADGASLLPSEIDRERKVILAEMRSRDSAS